MPSPAGHAPIFDHIVILVSYSTLLTLPQMLKDFFTVIIGGSHADGLTSNNLILFQDGSYIELIAFFDEADADRRAAHRWGRLVENTIIDWAYTLPPSPRNEDGGGSAVISTSTSTRSTYANFAAVHHRVSEAQAAYAYEDPVAGGRKRPDGEVLRWAVAAARDKRTETRVAAGKLPFWCLDDTPRELRVPYQGNSQTEHPSGALGVSRLTLRLSSTELPELGKVYDAIHDSAAGGDHIWHFKAHSGLEAGEGHHQISVAGADNNIPFGGAIELTLLGDGKSPKSVELLPGLHIKFET